MFRKFTQTRGAIWLAVVALATSGYADAQTTALPFVYDDGAGNTMPYRLFVPADLDPDQKYPLVLFLHGLGECGTDNLIQVTKNIDGLIAATQGERFTSYLVAPQTLCVSGSIWAGDAVVQMVAGIVDDVVAQYAVDERRIYVTGLSMGGFGTFEQLSHFPERYAAAVPIASGVTEVDAPAVAAVIQDIPIWVFHGTVDSVVPVAWSRAIVQALRAAGGDPRYTEYPTLDHNSWTVTYADQGDVLYPWLFSRILRGPRARIDVDREGGIAPLEVCVSAEESEAGDDAQLTSIEWEWGSDGSAQGQTACHTYEDPGGHTITLRVTNDSGYSSETSTRVVAHCTPGDVAPWSAEDVGDPILHGAARFEDEGQVLTLCAGGRPLAGSADSLHFVHREWAGDLTLTCKIAPILSSAGVRPVVGVMLRESLTTEARCAGVTVERSLGTIVRLQYRSEPGGLLRAKTLLVPSEPDPYSWVRIVHRGDEFVGSRSADGVSWEEVGSTTLEGFPETVYAGFLATGGDSSGTEEFSSVGARVQDITLEELAPGGLQIAGDTNQDGILDVSDAVWLLGHLYLGTAPTLPCEGGTAGNPGAGDLALVDVNADGAIDLSDAVRILGFLFLGSGPPALGLECIPIAGCPTLCP